MEYENPYINALTFSECGRWVDRDPEDFQNWTRRMMVVDVTELKTGRRIPRHRYNSDPTKP